MGTTYTLPVAVQASMPLFNAPYYIGIETSKLAQKLAESNLQSTEVDTRQAVASGYYLILISEESLRILKENLSNLRETLKSTKAMYKSGLAESTDVDQMASNVTMMENSFSNLQNTIEMNYNLLLKLFLPRLLMIWLKKLMLKRSWHRISIPQRTFNMIFSINRRSCQRSI